MTQPVQPAPPDPSARPSARTGLLADLRALSPAERGLWRLPLMWAAALAILFIPVIYVAVYLGSVWDPYGKLSALPVALVNLDGGTVYRGKQYNLGKDLVQTFHENPPAKFVRYPTEAAAQNAVRRGEVYFALTLPADFSRKAIAGSSSEHGLLRLYSAEGTSYFASRVGSSIATAIAGSLNERLGTNRWDTVQASLAQVQQGFADLRAGAAKLQNGAATLATGTGKLRVGAETLASGAAKASSGGAQLSQGARNLSGGVGKLTAGVARLSSGVRQLNAQAPGQAQLQPLLTGAASLRQGGTDLAGGLGKLSAGAASLASGAKTLSTGAAQADAGAGSLAAQLPALATGLTQLQGGAQSLGKGAADLNGGATRLGAGIAQLGGQSAQLGLNATQLSALQGGAGTLKTGADALVMGSAQLRSGAGTLVQGLGTAQAGAQKAATGAEQLGNGTAQLRTGAVRLQSGAATLAQNTAQAQAGAANLSRGTSSLETGLKTLVAGNLKIKSALGTISGSLPAQNDLDTLAGGASTLAKSSGDLANGVQSVSAGAARLATGAADADVGAIKLRDGLNTLYSKIPASTEQLGGDPAGLSASVQVVTEHTASVANNGAAFAPYFMALSLWVGCTLTTFIFPYLLIAESGRRTGQLARVLRKFAVPAVYVVAQALLVVLGVHLLGVKALHPGLLVFTAVAASLTFMLLVLALNLLLGAAGRLLALVLLVIQLAASGGSYPVELSSPFFRWLHTYIPVTDAINAMRYALFGSYEGQYGVFMLRMLAVALVSLAVALLSRRRWQYIADERFRSPLVLDVG
ncbi:YhgE/Pip family protein [Deinococcus altitudinis]|uniref:YhgE/Pip family protein n=1 Tax=Deinococcus altitudinis TaxID=468914 RepID=UPI0038922AE8